MYLQTVFFDSHGQAHVTCAPTHLDANAFGPSGASRPLTDAEIRALRLDGAVTHHTAATTARRVVHAVDAHEVDWLPDGGLLLAVAAEMPRLVQSAGIADCEINGGNERRVVALATALSLPSRPVAGLNLAPDEDDDED